MDKQLKEFVAMVDLMRQAQRNHFKADHGSLSKRDYLEESKRLEKQVDNFIKDILNPQVKLF